MMGEEASPAEVCYEPTAADYVSGVTLDVPHDHVTLTHLKTQWFFLKALYLPHRLCAGGARWCTQCLYSSLWWRVSP